MFLPMSERGGKQYEDPFAGVDVPLRWTAYFLGSCMTLLGVGFFVIMAFGKRAFTGSPSALSQVLAVCSAGIIIMGVFVLAVTFAWHRHTKL